VAPAHSKRSPAFQFYPRDFLSSPKVDRMPMTERGAYITLLSRCWLDNGLTTDLSELAYFCRMKPSQFERMWKEGRISQCFYERGGKFHNERLDIERKKQTANRQRQSDNAKAGWQKRGNATAMPPHSHHQESGIARAHAPAADADSSMQSSVSLKDKKGVPLDIAFQHFVAAYPENRRKGGFLVQQSYLTQVEKAGGPDVLLAALDNHSASEQWATPAHIPAMDKWLAEERWRQKLPSKATATGKTPWEPLSVTLARTGGKAS
jgi:uncharacterized protein YdaU (DUF1376 family)